MTAGDGNRTRVASLEGWSFTPKLHPHRIPNTKSKRPEPGVKPGVITGRPCMIVKARVHRDWRRIL